MAAATPDDADEIEEADRSSPSPNRPGVLAVVAGALCLVYVIWYILDLVALSFDPSLFNAAHDAADNIASRFVFSVLFLAIAYHGLDGLRRTLIDIRPRWSTRDAALRAVVAFLTMAAWIPVTVLVLWPSLRTLGS